MDVLAREIVATNPDAILASSGPSMAPPLARQTKTIPIVCVGGIDLVRLGIAVSVARPEGNVTGFTTDGGGSIEGKRLQLLHDTIPDVPRVAFLTPRYALESANGSYARAAAPSLGVELAPMILQEPIAEQTYHDAFARMSSDGVKSLLLAQSAENGTFAPLTGRLSRQSGIPAMSTYRDHSEAGGLMSFGAYYPDVYRRAAGYVARILAGEPPGELPIQDPVKFDFIINLAAARELGITFPNKILLGATEVIE